MTACAAWRRRRIGVAVLGIAVLHALFYALVVPPWSLMNEPQHLDYVLALRDGLRIPDIRQPLRADVMNAVWVSERWRTYRQARPPTPEAAAGRGGRSYEGYQPPAYYALMVPLAALGGRDPLRAMWAIRIVSPIFLAALAGIAWALARRWFPGEGDLVPISAALSVAAVPVVAGSCARVTNDGLVAVLVGGGVIAVLDWIERPSLRRSAAVGILVAAALLTKSPGALLLGVTAIGLGVVWRRGRLAPAVVLAAIGPVVLASVAWAAWTYGRYGVLDGTRAFLAVYGPASVSPLSPLAFVRDLWWSAWVPSPVFFFTGGRTKHLAVTGLLTGLVAIAGLGLARRPRPLSAIGISVVLGGGTLAILWMGNIAGLVPPVGRVLVPSYPAFAALTAGGWARLMGRRAALVPAVVVWVVAVAYEILWLVPVLRPEWLRL